VCDTLVAVGHASSDGSTILGKNSNRHPNEAQPLRYFPRQRHKPGAVVRSTWGVKIPQVKETNEFVLSQPYWMWGGEMGANEWSVAIGNEAVYSRELLEDKGLLGMDLIRLGLERTRTARECLDTILELLTRYGQGGQAFAHVPFGYHNSFIIADPHEAWVLETAGRHYVALRIADDVYAISNGYTIRNKWDVASPDLVEHAVEQGWSTSDKVFDFTAAYSEPHLREDLKCEARCTRSLRLLHEAKGRITVPWMMSILRDHGDAATRSGAWSPADDPEPQLCKHSTPQSIDQTTASYVGHLTDKLPPVHWFTEGASPCLTPFKPVFLGGAGISESAPDQLKLFNCRTRWWQQERLHRLALQDYATRAAFIRPQIQAFEEKCLAEVEELCARNKGSVSSSLAKQARQLSDGWFETGSRKVEDWVQHILRMPQRTRVAKAYAEYWETLSSEVELVLDHKSIKCS
jgi:dipeptidase